MMNFQRARGLCLAMVCCLVIARQSAAVEPAAPSAPDRLYPHAPAWVADQTLYEVNLRNFSAEGNIEGFTKQLPRLRDLGVGTLWFMPINPIGVQGHSGKLGSPYALSDYSSVNPELGTLDQLKAMVDQAHRMGMYVMIDWVASHTALDHPWVSQHPDWYKHDANGQLVHPLPTWADVVALNFDALAMRSAMIAAMQFWVTEAGVDGFRCDSAEFVPIDFWVQARNAVRKIKPVFMLAEGNNPELLAYAFDSAYAWYLPPNTEGIAKGTKTVADLVNFFKAEAPLLPGDGFRLNYTSNHDKNAWEGTTQELLGDGANAFAVLTFTAPGMPLIFNGQEAGAEHRQNLFDRDPIAWHDDPKADFYRKLCQLKRNHPALWNGINAAPMKFIAGPNASVLTFERETRGDHIVVMLNLGNQPVETAIPDSAKSLVSAIGESSPIETAKVRLKPWDFRIWCSKP